MSDLLKYPLLVLASSLAVICAAAFAGRFLLARGRKPSDAERAHMALILNAALTLLVLLVGFSFAMASGRYDQRKGLEEAEANAIGTEYVRADLLPEPAAARVRALLASYTEQRIQHYQERDPARLKQIDAQTEQLQAALWATVEQAAAAQPNAPVALTVAGMNDVLNSQGYTEAAWRNRLPQGAWMLMFTVAIACGLLLGRVGAHVSAATLPVLPLLMAVALFLIADIDSPRRGVIRVVPENLIAFQQSLTSLHPAPQPQPEPPPAPPAAP